jgi:acetate kinase
VRILAVNAGSSSLKLSLIDGQTTVADFQLERWEDGDVGAVAALVGGMPQPDAVVHRVVHGGSLYDGPVLVDEATLETITSLTPLAPLHQPRSLAAIAAAREIFAGVIEVACFDTAFHSSIPERSATYALPADWRERWPLRRFGFHGLSHAYAARRASVLAGRAQGGMRAVTCHLGSGSSLCAVDRGVSVDTTMGFTPLEGLVMRTRSGTVDPGLLMWLIEVEGLTAGEVSDALERRSGLAALAGGHGDMRDVVAAAAEGDPRAVLARAVHDHRVSQSIASMAVSMGGLDAVVFTGGIGEHSREVRAAVAGALRFLGIDLDERANAEADGDADITSANAAVRSLVVTAREDLQMAAEVATLLGA